GRPRPKRRVDRGRVAKPPARLDRDAGGSDRLDEPGCRAPRERAAEVDEVKPLRAFGGEPGGGRPRIAALDRHVLAVTFEKADAASLEDVDRGDDVEAVHALVVAC